MHVAVAGVEDVGDAKAVGRADFAGAAQRFGQAARRHGAVHADVISDAVSIADMVSRIVFTPLSLAMAVILASCACISSSPPSTCYIIATIPSNRPRPRTPASANDTAISIAMLETAFDRYIDLLGATNAFELIESAFRRRAEMFRRSSTVTVAEFVNHGQAAQ